MRLEELLERLGSDVDLFYAAFKTPDRVKISPIILEGDVGGFARQEWGLYAYFSPVHAIFVNQIYVVPDEVELVDDVTYTALYIQDFRPFRNYLIDDLKFMKMFGGGGYYTPQRVVSELQALVKSFKIIQPPANVFIKTFETGEYIVFSKEEDEVW